MPVESTRLLVALVWLMVGARVILVWPHPKHLPLARLVDKKALTLLYHVRVPALTIVLYSHSTMVKRTTEHASSQPQRDLCALLGRYVVNSQCAFPCQ